MNKILMIGIIAAFASPSFAQDKEWRGFYLGGNGAVSSDRSSAEATLQINQVTNVFVTGRGLVVVPGTTRDFAASKRDTNWSGGGQAGYLWQSDNIVFGVEGDFDPFRRTVSAMQSHQLPQTILSPVTTVTAQRDVRVSNEVSIRGRLGYAFGKTLIFGTGGYSNARVRVNSTDTFTDPGGPGAGTPVFNGGPVGPVITTASESRNQGGWNVGGGLERKLGKRYSIGAEYRHTDLGSAAFALSDQSTVNTGPDKIGNGGQPGLPGSVSTGPTAVSLKSDTFRFRFNIHF
ncbi:MAG: outer membrane beta-barrel protein [Pyrinomonadaceae bacterium]